MQFHIYATTIRILAKGFLPISLIAPLKLKEILNEVRYAVGKINPDYDLVIKRLHLYYDIKVVTFGIDNDRNHNSTISSIHTAIYMATTDIISDRDSTSSNHRSKDTTAILHTFAGRKTIHCTKFRNIHWNKTAGTKDM